MERIDLRSVLPWALPLAVVVVFLGLFTLFDPLIAWVVLGVAIAVAVVRFAGWFRLVQIAAVLFLVTFFTAMLIRFLPGDPTDTLISFASPADKQALREDLGLESPIWVQYGRFAKDFFTGETNYYQSSGRAVAGQPVWDRLDAALPRSIQLILYAQIVALTVAIPLGIFTAYKAGTLFDKITNTTAFGFLSLPNFVVGYLLIFYLGVQRNWFPTQGYTAFGADPYEHFKGMVLPVLSLAVGQIAVYMRLLRSDMVQTLQEDFITMARSKGLTTSRILLRHALRPSTFSLLTVAAINLGALIGGTVVIEAIFGLGGVGTMIVDAILRRQYVALQTIVGLIAIAYVLLNVCVDLLYSVLDPRIRHARA